jgi:hypothetical protein
MNGGIARKRSSTEGADCARTGRSSDRLRVFEVAAFLAAKAGTATAADDKRRALRRLLPAAPHQKIERVTFHVFGQIDVGLQDVDQWSHEG